MPSPTLQKHRKRVYRRRKGRRSRCTWRHASRSYGTSSPLSLWWMYCIHKCIFCNTETHPPPPCNKSFKYEDIYLDILLSVNLLKYQTQSNSIRWKHGLCSGIIVLPYNQYDHLWMV